MTKLSKRRRVPGAGAIHSPRACTSIVFDEEMFHRIQGEADRRQLSFGSIVREKLEQIFQVEDELSTEVVESADNSVELKKEDKSINVIRRRPTDLATKE